MKFLFSINHPAHYHLFKIPFRELKIKGNDVVFVVKDKDILIELLQSEGVDFVKLRSKNAGHHAVRILMNGFIDLIIKDLKLLRFSKKYKPDLMIGTDYSITHVGAFLNIPSIVFNEDDYSINKLFCRFSYPFANHIVSPVLCDVGKYSFKKISYEGYQKLSYLHPTIFSPDKEIVKKYLPAIGRYFMIRLISFSAGHDIEMDHGGIDEKTLVRLINLLKPFGKVLISSENSIPKTFMQYSLKIDVRDIHHMLAYASLFIGDSQSMIVEAAMLGTPSVRYNSFVGKISVLEELEQRFGLCIGICNSEPELLLKTVHDLINKKNLKEEYQSRRINMLKEKINVSSFLVWLLENYPQSIKTLAEFPDYQLNFK